MTKRQPWRAEEDQWSRDGARIDAPESVAAVQKTLENSGPVIVEWRHYRGASAPDRLFFDDYESYATWLEGIPPGDSIWIWNFETVCTDDAAITHGKQADDDGTVPLGGAY